MCREAHVVLYLTRVSFAGVSVDFKKATKFSERLEVVFNGVPIKVVLTNKDGLTNRWTLDRENVRDFSNLRIAFSHTAIRVAAACFRISTTRSLFE